MAQIRIYIFVNVSTIVSLHADRTDLMAPPSRKPSRAATPRSRADLSRPNQWPTRYHLAAAPDCALCLLISLRRLRTKVMCARVEDDDAMAVIWMAVKI